MDPKPQSIVKKPDLKLPLIVVEFCWNRLDEPIFMAGSKPMRTEFGICQRLESCGNVFVSKWYELSKVEIGWKELEKTFILKRLKITQITQITSQCSPERFIL